MKNDYRIEKSGGVRFFAKEIASVRFFTDSRVCPTYEFVNDFNTPQNNHNNNKQLLLQRERKKK
jgi:hypothetical protein